MHRVVTGTLGFLQEEIGTYTCNTIYVQRNTTTVNCPLKFHSITQQNQKQTNTFVHYHN